MNNCDTQAEEMATPAKKFAYQRNNHTTKRKTSRAALNAEGALNFVDEEKSENNPSKNLRLNLEDTDTEHECTMPGDTDEDKGVNLRSPLKNRNLWGFEMETEF